MSTITPASFDAKKLSMSEVKKLDNGSQQVYLNYDGKRLRVQAPRMPVPMDASDYQDNKKYKVNISFRDRSNTKVAAYIKMLEEIDSFVIDNATKSAGKWFKSPGASREMVNAFFSPSAKVSKDKDGNPKDFPPVQGLALKQRAGAFDSELYDNKNQLIEGMTPIEVLRRGCEISTINEVAGIWIIGTKFGLTWKLYQARVDQPAEGAGSRGFLGAEEDDTPVVARAGAGVSKAEEADLFAAVMPKDEAAEDEEEEDDEENEDEVVKPVPVPAKKVAAAPAAAPAAAAVAAPAAPAAPAAEPKKIVKKVVAKKA